MYNNNIQIQDYSCQEENLTWLVFKIYYNNTLYLFFFEQKIIVSNHLVCETDFNSI